MAALALLSLASSTGWQSSTAAGRRGRFSGWTRRRQRRKGQACAVLSPVHMPGGRRQAHCTAYEPSICYILALPCTYTNEEIEKSGLWPVLAEATRLRRRLDATDGAGTTTTLMEVETSLKWEIRGMIDEHLKREIVP